MSETPQRFLPLSPTDLHVLLALARQDSYGYALLRTMAGDSGGAVTPDIGSLYRTLGRLLAAGLITEAGERPAERGKPRRYYRLTDLGRIVLEAELKRLDAVLDRARADVLAEAT